MVGNRSLGSHCCERKGLRQGVPTPFHLCWCFLFYLFYFPFQRKLPQSQGKHGAPGCRLLNLRVWGSGSVQGAGDRAVYGAMGWGGFPPFLFRAQSPDGNMIRGDLSICSLCSLPTLTPCIRTWYHGGTKASRQLVSALTQWETQGRSLQ